MNSLTKRLFVWAAVVGFILLIPFATNAPWTAMDYFFAGGVLFGAATLYETSARRMKNRVHRLLVGFGVLVVVVLIWAWAVA